MNTVPHFPPQTPEAASETKLAEIVDDLVGGPPASTTIERPSSRSAEDVLHTVLSALGPLLNGAVYFMDRLEGRIVYATDHMFASLGYRTDQIRAMTLDDVSELVHPRDRRVREENAEALTRLGDDAVSAMEVRIRAADGRWRWVEARERVLTRTRDGKPRLTIGVVRNVTERQKLRQALTLASKELLTVEEEERRRIARELHDSTTQLLTGARLLLSQLQARHGEASEALGRVNRTIAQAQQEIRTLSFLLHPPQLAAHGLRATLEDLARGFSRRSGLRVSVTVDGTPRLLSPTVELALFRVAQEGLLNAHKHAHASSVDVRLRYRDKEVCLEVEDDGVGLDSSAAELTDRQGVGVGLSGMKARMAQLGGSLHFSQRDRGLLLGACVPTDASPWHGSQSTS